MENNWTMFAEVTCWFQYLITLTLRKKKPCGFLEKRLKR